MSKSGGGAAAGADPDEIRHRAYILWNQDGCPEGRALEYWLRAEAELASEGQAAGGGGGNGAEAPRAADEPEPPARPTWARAKAKEKAEPKAAAVDMAPETAPSDETVAKRHASLVQQRRTRAKAEG